MNKPKICFVSSSGGHWEQLQKLKPLADKYSGFFVTEKTQFDVPLASYFMKQTDLKDKLMPFKMLANFFSSLWIWIKENLILLLLQVQWWHILFICYQSLLTKNSYLLKPLAGLICPLLQAE